MGYKGNKKSWFSSISRFFCGNNVKTTTTGAPEAFIVAASKHFSSAHKKLSNITLKISRLVAWTPVATSYFQECTWGISGSIPRENNAWSVRMPLHMSRISRPPLVGRKPVRK
ncbi:hypothetical protein MTR_0009s0100 [Medicago truncatula]|uniref:Uncharacterized protein n=1 Tax=Medicago truncatula TaxID=3880 RepID=A0A072TVG1_MEDTR|nr:hypothetical protein MTR_0009s0100 [Medicago truncatula]